MVVLHGVSPAPRLFHFRGAKGLEVDLVLDDGGRVVLCESRSGATVVSDFFSGLIRLREILAETDALLQVEARVVYGGDSSQRRTTVDVVAWAAVQERSW